MDLPLSFKFGYIKANGEDAFLGGVSQETEMTVVLPAGEAKNNFNLTLFVDATDTWRAKTRAYHNVVVTPLTVIDKNAVSHFADNIVDAFKANDLSSVIGQVTSTVNVLNEASSTGIEYSLMEVHCQKYFRKCEKEWIIINQVNLNFRPNAASL